MTGCEGTIRTAKDDGHGADANVFGVINASYTDNGGAGVPSLSGSDEAILRPKRKQAEHYTGHQGIQTENTADPMGGGRNIGWIDHGDWISIAPMNLENSAVDPPSAEDPQPHEPPGRTAPAAHGLSRQVG